MYSDAFCKVYDELTLNVDYEKIINFIMSKSESLEEGSIALDLCCGTGTISKMLTDRGFESIGVDSSFDMLIYAREKDDKTVYLNQDVTELDLYGTINLATCVLDGFNHLSCIEDFREVIERVSLFTEKDGLLIFDINSRYKHSEVMGNNAFIYPLDDIYTTWQNEYDEESGSVDIFLDFFIKSGDRYIREEQSFREILIEPLLAVEILKENGYEIISVTDDYTENQVSEKTERITFVARKLYGQNNKMHIK